MEISQSDDIVSIAFTEEETEVLTKVKELLTKIAKEVWDEEYDDFQDLQYFFSQMSGNLENILNGKYEMA